MDGQVRPGWEIQKSGLGYVYHSLNDWLATYAPTYLYVKVTPVKVFSLSDLQFLIVSMQVIL